MIITGFGCDIGTLSYVAKTSIVARRFRFLGRMSRNTDLY